MARIWLLAAMLGALGFGGLGTSVSRATTVTLSIPAISVLSLPERNLVGKELGVELSSRDLSQGALLLPLEVKSNVPWAVTARVLSQDRVELRVAVEGGPEVIANTEEVSLLSGRPGRHELRLRLKLDAETWPSGVRLVLKVVSVNSL